MVMTSHRLANRAVTSQDMGTSGWGVMSANTKKTRLRTLSNFPMNHGHSDTLQTVSRQRQSLDQKRESAQKATIASGNLLKQSRMLFEGALEDKNSSQMLPRLEKRSSMDSNAPSYGLRSGGGSRMSSSSRPGSNGPTIEGSLIYNRDNQINDMPLLANHPSDSPVKAAMTPEIQKTLRKSNSSLRVVSPASGSATSTIRSPQMYSPCFQDFLLVSTAVKAPESDLILEEDFSFGDPEETSTTIEVAKTLRFLKKKRDISFASDELGEKPNVAFDTPLKDETAKGSNEITEKSAPEKDDTTEDKQERTRSEKARRRRVTWVDDATISSPNVTNENQAKASDAPDNGSKQPTDLGVGEKAENDVINEETETNKNILCLKDLQNNSMSLPDFICPTSEDKSRQARTRHWIHSNNFKWANRSVPLL